VNPAQRLELLLPFAINEHGFVERWKGDTGGNPYIIKHAIQRRLDKVAPNWSLSEPHIVMIHEDTVILSGTLSIDDQSHGDIGTGIIQRIRYDKGKKPYEIAPYDLSRETAKAFKSAASDLLPRCAVHFGIGWYMRLIPKSFKEKVTSTDGLKEYLTVVKEIIMKAQGDVERAREAMGNGDKRRLT